MKTMPTFMCWDNVHNDEPEATSHEAETPEKAAEAFADSIGLLMGGTVVHVRDETGGVHMISVEVHVDVAPTKPKPALTCAFCGGPAQGNYSIHRDGFGKGPEVPLCDADGSKLKPSCPEIWARISTLPSDQW